MIEILPMLLSAVKAAGAKILHLQQNGFSISHKANKDIVTQADLAANDLLRSALMAAFPSFGWLSEETVDDLSRLQCKQVWIVDPIDGTREYATNIPEYAISVALVEEGVPKIAVVFNPAREQLFYAVLGEGAWLNTQRIHCRTHAESQLLLLASRSEHQRGEWDRYQQLHQVKPIGSIAYKLGLLASGSADATFSLGPKNEWDIAAGVLLVLEAGGMVTDKAGKPIRFNQKNVLVNGIVATTPSANTAIFALINQK